MAVGGQKESGAHGVRNSCMYIAPLYVRSSTRTPLAVAALASSAALRLLLGGRVLPLAPPPLATREPPSSETAAVGGAAGLGPAACSVARW